MSKKKLIEVALPLEEISRQSSREKSIRKGFDNNNITDRLNGHPLTDDEMKQIIDKINDLKTPLELNGFINGKSVSIRRDHPGDRLHLGKEISLKIYDRTEIEIGRAHV